MASILSKHHSLDIAKVLQQIATYCFWLRWMTHARVDWSDLIRSHTITFLGRCQERSRHDARRLTTGCGVAIRSVEGFKLRCLGDSQMRWECGCIWATNGQPWQAEDLASAWKARWKNMAPLFSRIYKLAINDLIRVHVWMSLNIMRLKYTETLCQETGMALWHSAYWRPSQGLGVEAKGDILPGRLSGTTGCLYVEPKIAPRDICDMINMV